MYYISVAILAFKHPKFQHEKEWRLFYPVQQGRLTKNIGFDLAANGSTYRVPGAVEKVA
jgi:hypothetical protein